MKFLSIEQVAKITGFGAWTVRKWAREGKIPARKFGREWRVREDSLRDFEGFAHANTSQYKPL